MSRAVVQLRAGPTAREAALLKAICLETLNFLRRRGVEPGTRRTDG